MFLVKILVASVASVVTQASVLSNRQPQGTVVCDESFSWAWNAEQQTPCTVAAYVTGACGTKDYTVLPLIQGSRYTAPNTSTANACTCSWASYNLLSACTACQLMTESIPDWDGWNTDCPAYLSGITYFPSNITLPNATSIPFWAEQNPLSWTGHQFNVEQAKGIVNQGQQKSKMTPVGPIVGGVVGGIAALALAGIICCFLIRHGRLAPKQGQGIPSLAEEMTRRPMMHDRSISDLSRKSLGHSLGDGGTQLASGSPSLMMTRRQSSGRNQPTHLSGVRSLSYFGPMSKNGYTSLPPQSTLQTTRANIIEPIVFRADNPSRVEVPTNEEGVGGAIYPLSGASLLPTTLPTPEGSASEGVPQRPRLNPPIYTPYSGIDPQPAPTSFQPSSWIERGLGHRLQSQEQESTDVQNTWSPTESVTGSGSEGGLSAFYSIVGRMGLDFDETVAGHGASTVATGHSGQVVSSKTGVLYPRVSNPDEGM